MTPARAAVVAAPHWRDRLLAWRDRLISSPQFRRWAQAFWPTRWIARRRAGALFDLVAGFVYTQVLLACVQLRLFDLLLAHGPLSLPALAQRLQLPLPATERLVLAAVSLRLLEARPQGRYGLGPLGAPLAGNPGLAALVEHHAALYRDLTDPLALLRKEATGGPGAARSGAAGVVPAEADAAAAASPAPGHLARFWPYAGHDAPQALTGGQVAPYSALMAASQPLVAEQVLQAYALHRHRCLLDVGGGDGSFACAAAHHAPGLRVMVFDLPGVAPAATQRFAQAGLGGRCTAQGGDFFRDELPRGADLITLLRVVHDHDDDRVLCLLRAVRRALPPGGRLLLAEPMADTPGAPGMGHAYFGFYLLAMGRGQPRTEARLRELLATAGFARVRRLRTPLPLQASALIAEASGLRSASTIDLSVNLD